MAPSSPSRTCNNNANDDIDSDVDANGMSDTITVTDGSNTDIDLGLKEVKDPGDAQVGDLVFIDTNGNGVYDAGVDGLAEGVTVDLLDENGAVVDTTTTDANGEYCFDGPRMQASTRFASRHPRASTSPPKGLPLTTLRTMTATPV